MGIRTGVKAGLAVLVVLVTAISAGERGERFYDVPKAMVVYKISGGGVLNDDLNLSIEGKGKLRFREWGDVELLENHIVERTTGSLHYLNTKEKCEKRQKKQIYDVDFENKKILERPLPKGKEAVNMTEGLEWSGQQMVANVVCDMWESRGVRKCLYKKILLFTEYRALGLYYREEATDVQFDINISEEAQCAIPSYPVKKFALYTNHFKTKNKKTPEAFSERIVEVLKRLDRREKDGEELSSKEKKALLHMMGEPVFETQKHLLPKLLETMKKTRACLVQAKETAVANACLYDLIQLKSYFSENEHKRIKEWKSEREKILDRFDEKIVFLQSKMKCIRGAKNIDDLSVCMK